MNLFFFGTLLDQEVRAIVFGHPLAVRPAVLRGFRRPHVAGRHYPMLMARPGGRVAGLLAEGIDDETVRRLRLYEGWEYQLHPFRLETATGPVEAHVFICPPGIEAAEPEWRLDRWQLRHKRVFLRHLRRQSERVLDQETWHQHPPRLWPGS